MNPEIDNIFKLDGRVPLGRAIPFGLQQENSEAPARFLRRACEDEKDGYETD